LNFDPALLDELARVFAEAAVRELQTKNGVDAAKQFDAVEDKDGNYQTGRSGTQHARPAIPE
jgi:hypothetical protein